MKQGKIAESVLKRSILKQLHLKRSDVLLAAGVGEDCAAITVAEDEVVVLSSDPVIWRDSLDGRCAVHANLNDLAAGGAHIVFDVLVIQFGRDCVRIGCAVLESLERNIADAR